MSKEYIDKLIELMESHYLFKGKDREKWEELKLEYRKKYLFEFDEFEIVDMFRGMEDLHTSYELLNNTCFCVPLAWQNNRLLYLERREGKLFESSVLSVNSIEINHLIKEYSSRYSQKDTVIKRYILQDIMNGRYSKDCFLSFEIEDEYGNIRLLEAKMNKIIPACKGGGILVSRPVKVINGNTLYIHITDFNDYVTMERAFRKIDKRIQTVIFDIRNNRGGKIHLAKEWVGHFAQSKSIIKEYKIISREDVSVQIVEPKVPFIDLSKKDIYIVVNGQTMSSAEYVFLLGMKNLYKCVVVGAETLGMSGECRVYTIVDRGVLRITTKKYDFLNKQLERGIPPDLLLNSNNEVTDDIVKRWMNENNNK